MTGMYDIHCHLIPDVDDGSGSMEESLQMLQKEYDDGVRGIIATPHFRYDVFECPADKIQENFEKLKEAAQKTCSEIRLGLGCEFHACLDMTDLLKSGQRPAMNNTKYVLTEFPVHAEPQYVRTFIYRMVSTGYHPIIAHIERYPAIVSDLRLVEELIELGAEVQINADSVTGDAGWRMKKICRRLLKEGLVAYVATDAHNTGGRSPQIGRCASYIEKKFGKEYADRLLRENPSKLFT